MKKIKFRAWHKTEKTMSAVEIINLSKGAFLCDVVPIPQEIEDKRAAMQIDTARVMMPNKGRFCTFDEFEFLQYTGLKDKEREEWFVGDIGEFDNGDKFVLKMEDWLEVYVDWFGVIECEDQARDLYRIEKAKKISNIYENPKLLR